MTTINKFKNILTGSLLLACSVLLAGNEDRAGQAGANELLINPWARTGGWGGANAAFVKNVEALSLNVGGLSFCKGTEVTFAHTQWLKGSGLNINALGLAQKVGESGALGISVMSLDFGDIQRTTEINPDGGNGNFTPQFITIGLGYSREFSNSIHGGIALKVISEAIADVKAQGLAIDAGIQYVTGFNKERDNLKFGIALRNVGAPMKYDGEGLSFRNSNDEYTSNINVLMQQKADRFELPSLVSIATAYDIKMAEDHRLTTALNFTSNSFIRDQFALGLEYGFKNLLMIRGAYTIDKKDKNAIIDEEISALIGPSGGVSIQLPLGKTGKYFGIDYAYRATKTFDGTHTFGARFVL